MQKCFRLTNSKSFDIIYKKGKGVSEESMTLITLASKYSNIKAGFVAGKKVGKSVTRNRVKRRMKEAFRLMLPRISRGYSYILVAKALAATLNYHEIASVIERLLSAAGKLK